MVKKIFIVISLILLISCEGGLKPEPEKKSFLTGTIVFENDNSNWPSVDSLNDLRVVAFKNFPPSDILQEVISGKAYFTLDSLPYFVDQANFKLEIPDAPVEIKYIAVALQYGQNISTDWLAAGVYTESGDNTQNSSVTINQGETKDITIFVDFKNLPPQPF